MKQNLRNEYDVLIGQKIRSLRKKKKRSQEDVANSLGVSYQQVQKYESGANRISVTTLLKIADFLGVTFTECIPTYLSDTSIRVPADSDCAQLLSYWDKITDTKIKEGVLFLLESLVSANTNENTHRVLKNRR